MTTSATPLGGESFTPGGIFSPDALDTNRAGRLTDEQRREYTGIDREFRKNELVFAGILTVIGLLILSSNGPSLNAWARPLVAAACFVGAVALVLYSLPGSDRMSADLRRGEVLTIEGAMEKHEYTTNSGNSSSTSYYLDIANQHFEVYGREYRAAPGAGWVRLYYLPKTRKVVNLERLPDPPLPADLAQPSMDGIKSLLHGVTHTRGQEHHEAAARLNQVEAAVAQSMSEFRVENATPPPAATASQPLAQAILGTWRGGPMTVTFAPDGTATLTTFGGRAKEGRWRVDDQGRLHADTFGHDQVGDAWVAGDTLTISVGGEGIRLVRTS